METGFDIVVIGSGIGGATLVNGLAASGARILILERGERLTDSPAARDHRRVFIDGCYRPAETWYDEAGTAFNPGNYYYVGGNSKFYGAVLLRYRQEDFGDLVFDDGVSPAWPFAYDELAPYYDRAEALYQVRGAAGEDPTEPPRAGGFPFPPVPDERPIANVRERLREHGLHPFSLPLAVDIDRWLARAQTPWDAFPDTVAGKLDGESAALAPVLDRDNVTLWTGAHVDRLVAAPDGRRIDAIEVTRNGERLTVRAPVIVLAAGAVNSAALLLRSADANNPHGLANSSDQVGRNFMNHNASALMAVHPFVVNDAVYQKTLALNDFYLGDGGGGRPLGNIQLLGKINGDILKANMPTVPSFLLHWLARHSVDWYVMTEDLPSPDSRVRLNGDGDVVLEWRRSNMTAHNKLVITFILILKKLGYPIVLKRLFDQKTPSHQCGTVRMGLDPAQAPLDPYCWSYDHSNLFVVDASFLPTSAAVNPALTVAAQALRVADHINQTKARAV